MIVNLLTVILIFHQWKIQSISIARNVIPLPVDQPTDTPILGFLAEVALKRHYEDMQKQNDATNGSNINQDQTHQTSKPEQKNPSTPLFTTSVTDEKKESSTKTINKSYTLEQIRKFSEKRLLSMFTEYKRDIKTKRYSYRCQLLPSDCQIKFDSFVTDQESKQNIIQHLRQHLCNLEQTMPQIKLVSCRKIRQNVDKVKQNVGDKKIIKNDEKSSVAIPLSKLNDNGPMTAIKTDYQISRFESTGNNQSNQGNKSLLIQKNEQNEEVTAKIGLEKSSAMDENISLRPSNLTPSNDTVEQAKMRSLALDYIDDIRKKSSSAAKSIIINGDKSVIYQCKICPDKQFTSTNGLIFHYKKHAGLKPYVCELCSATFTRQHSLNYHMLIHLNKSRFVCSECSRHFRHPSHFKEHMRRHTGETPFQCSDCLIRFKTRNTYKRHLQTKHSKILTSKGGIELSTSLPYQSISSNDSRTSTVVATKVGPIVTISSTNALSTQSESSSTSNITKPRRKYGIRYLHENIETMNKYEQSQFEKMKNQSATFIHNFHSDNTNTAANMNTIDQMAAFAATAQTAPGSNITILNFQNFPAVQLLNNGDLSTGGAIYASTIPTAITKKNAMLNYEQANVGPANITLVSVGPYTHFGDGKTVLTPIQMTNRTPSLLINNETGNENLTELTSAMPLTINCGNNSNNTEIPSNLYHLQGPVVPQNYEVMIQDQQSYNTAAQPNDNFMRLLEAIEMTEVE
ncbi:hypothetical protein NH340_JMT05557 [Sarcoptes scabiei]|nr:hypothetical protein NH340_JMT05557 [Sarcoptes scabiei]